MNNKIYNPYFSLIRTIWRYGIPWRGTIVKYYIVYILAAFIKCLGPYAFGRTIIILQNFHAGRLGEAIYWLVMGLGIKLIFFILHGPSRIIECNIALKIQQTFELNLYEKLSRLPLKWHQTHHSGVTTTRVKRASKALYNFAEDQYIYIQAIFTFLTSIGFLLWISIPIGILNLISGAIIMSIVILFDKKLIPLYNTENEIENKIGAVLIEYLNNMTTILTLRLGNLTHLTLTERMKTRWPSFKKSVSLNEIKWFSMEILLSIFQTIFMIGYIIYTLNSKETIVIGAIIMIFRYQWEAGSVFYSLTSQYSRLVRMHADVQGIEPLLVDMAKFTQATQINNVFITEWHTIRINELNFQHIKNTNICPTFSNLNFTIKRGEKIVLIGPSGGGKSSLLNILGGLYIPDNVKLWIDKNPFTFLEPLRNIATLIPQDPEIFENTLLFNISMGLPIKPNELEEIIQLSGFSSVLAKLPEGLDTIIYEKGLNLSVGQKQRLALARGLFAARFSSLISMDEPTSSLDLATESTVLKNILYTFSQKTIIISLHRLHLLPIFDRIIMLDKSVILADGSPDHLLNNIGPVKDLWEKYQINSII